MGTSSILGITTTAGNGNGNGNGGSSSPGGGGSSTTGCCDMTVKCRCRWRLGQNCSILSPAVVFFLAASLLIVSIACFYAWLVFTPRAGAPFDASELGCREDNEGSWSVGVFYGDSPFTLRPIEDTHVWRNASSAWPVANPVVTCASASAAGFPSNFVADPFLYNLDDGTLYLFYETKNPTTMQGDIGVAKSGDGGATWTQLGVALDEDWHLSYPYVFDYGGQIYMMPESSQKGELRLYRAINFPLQWKLERVVLKKPLVDTVMFEHDGKYWLLGSDHSGFGARKNGQLEIWYSSSGSPLGPWRPHKRNPIYNGEKTFGARNGGRPFTYDGSLYRVGQDCGETYGRRIRTFRVQVLSEDEYKEVEVPSGFVESKKGRNAWNGVRHHHLDVQRLRRSGQWVGVMDGDRVPSGDSVNRLIAGCGSFVGVAALVLLLGLLLGAVNCIVPPPPLLNYYYYYYYSYSCMTMTMRGGKWSNKLMRLCNRVNRLPTSLRFWVKPNSWAGRLVLVGIFCAGVFLMCNGVNRIYGGNGAEEAYAVNGHYSQFTMVTMTYDARLWNLKMYIKHYSRCSSVREIVVVWNKGTPPDLTQFDSAVPVRIRVEEKNSLNNRFNIDPLIKTRAVLELDDDIMMTCNDIERGFKVWRDHPDRIVGFYPRYVDGGTGTPPALLRYRAEKHARKHKGYNMILTGAAFLDADLAFHKYWSQEAREGRKVVDRLFNCEDVLMNYLYAVNNNTTTSSSSASAVVEYVRPAWAIDTSKFSSVAISRNTNVHYGIRSECLAIFTRMYGNLGHRKSPRFNSRGDGWDV